MRLTARGALLVLGLAAAGWLLWLSVTANLQRACFVNDSPYLDICSQAPRDDAARQQALKHRIGQNPGESAAYAQLTHIAQAPDREALLRAAVMVAPQDPNVLRARAALALQQNRFTDAIGPLVQLTQFYSQYTEEPAKALARLVAQGHAAAVQAQVSPGSNWLRLVLEQMNRLELPLPTAVPLVMHASALGSLAPEDVVSFIARLKLKGNWADAYALWVSQHKRPVPILYNASFDEEFQDGGFDWEITPVKAGRAGATLATRHFSGRGQVLEVQYLGRAMPTPIARQHLLLTAGRYRLTGQYMTARLKTENGLAWAVRCTGSANDAIAGRSPALMETRDAWQPFEFEFSVPGNCGPVASLQLESFATYESTAGIRGRAYFDAFLLARLPQ